MTLEEKSERYVFSNPPSVVIDNHSYFLPSDLKRAYLEGAKENGIVWHDLRKDPNDLPIRGHTVLVYGNNKCEFGDYRNDDNWYTYPNDISHEVIAWCEIPQFQGVAE